MTWRYSIPISVILSASLIFFGFFSTSYSAPPQVPAAPTTGADGCGKDTMTFGCHAYLIGPGGAATAASLAGKVHSAAIDTQQVMNNPGLVQKMNQNGPVPILYTNAFCESRFGGCQGPYLSSQTSSQWGEPMPDPRGPGFQANFQKQLGWVKQVGGKVIEIDNIDSYIEKGHKNAVIQLIRMAQNAGINVVSKNVSDPAILGLPNVVGAIVEPGSGSASQYRSSFSGVGKKCAGVVIINGGGGDAYTSVTKGNQGGQGEYTKFLGCNPNSAGMQIAGTPVAGAEVISPQGIGAVQQTGASQGGAPGVFGNQQGQGSQSQGAQSGGSSGGGQGSGGSQSGAGTSPGSFPSGANPFGIGNQSVSPSQGTTDIFPTKTESQSSMQSDAQKPKSSTITAEKEEDVSYSDGNARLTCIPKNPLRGEKVVLAWDCDGATAAITASDTRIKIDTGNKSLGSVKLLVQKNTQFRLACGSKGSTGVSVCNVKVQLQNQTKSIPDTRLSVPQSGGSNLCFFGFCL